MNIKETNGLIKHISNIFENVLAERGLLESKLFPVSEYISVSCYHTYENLYDVMKQVWARTTPEQLAKKSKTLLSDIHALSITYNWLYYSLGRMGVLFNELESDASREPAKKREEWKYILEQWYRLATSYFNTGKHSVLSSGKVNLAFDDKTIKWLLDNMQPVTEDQVKKVRRAVGAVDLYAFLEECEARAKIIDHGPYKIGKDEILVVSEYTRLYDGKGKPWLPWSETEAKLPSSTLGVAMTIKNATATFNDVGTMTVEPGDYSRLVTRLVSYTKRGNKVVPLGIDELPAYGEAADAAQAELYMRFSEWDKKKLMLAGAMAYWRGFARYTDAVGITDKVDWNISKSVEDKYVPFFMKNDADAAFMRFGRFDDEMVSDPTLYLLPEK